MWVYLVDRGVEKMKEYLAQVIGSVVIAIIAVVLGYFVDPLLGVLGLLIALVDIGAYFLSKRAEADKQELLVQKELEA